MGLSRTLYVLHVNPPISMDVFSCYTKKDIFLEEAMTDLSGDIA